MVWIDYFFCDDPYSVRGQGIEPHIRIVNVALWAVILSNVGKSVLLSFVVHFHCNFILPNSLGPPRETLGAAFGAPKHVTTIIIIIIIRVLLSPRFSILFSVIRHLFFVHSSNWGCRAELTWNFACSVTY